MKMIKAWVENKGLVEAAELLCIEQWRLQSVVSGKQKEAKWMQKMRLLIDELEAVGGVGSPAADDRSPLVCPWCGVKMEQQGVNEQTHVRHPKAANCFMGGKSFNCDLVRWGKWQG